MKQCELLAHKKFSGMTRFTGDFKTIHVNENIGDGSWRVEICETCAKLLGLKEGDDLPDTKTINKILGNYPLTFRKRVE